MPATVGWPENPMGNLGVRSTSVGIPGDCLNLVNYPVAYCPAG